MIVVTGGIACGKSTFVEVAREMGIDVVDADEWYHKLFVGSSIQEYWRRTLFGGLSIKTVAFRHDNWSIYEQSVAEAFCTYIGNTRPDICVIPELFKRETFFRVTINIGASVAA